jgi:mRNA interferase MazF
MKDGIKFNQREIVLIPFPYSDLTGAKQRPALIVSNKVLNSAQDRICCLITSNPTNEGLEIKKEHFEEGGLPFKSWAKPQRLFTIDERIIKKRICRISRKFHEEILRGINRYLELEEY